MGNIAQTVGIANAGSGLLALGAPVNGGPGFAYAAGLGNANIGVQQLFANTTFHYADNLTLIRGRHMMKMGGQVLREWINVFYSGNSGRTGYINFGGRFTAQNAASPTGTQIGEADFMLGLPTDIGRGSAAPAPGDSAPSIYGVYFQDDWRVSNNLTLNLGLRWEYHTPWVEVAEPAGELTASSAASSNSPAKNWRDIAARSTTPTRRTSSRASALPARRIVLNKKLVFRGAYTISSYLEGTGTNLRLPLNPPLQIGVRSALQHAGLHAARHARSTRASPASIRRIPIKGATIRLWDPYRASRRSRSSGTVRLNTSSPATTCSPPATSASTAPT